jgi:hypothetical protein
VPSTGNNPLVDSGSATSEGALTLSSDGRFLTIAGYNAAAGTAGVATSTTISRGVAEINFYGTVDTSTVLANNTTATGTYSGNNIRSAASADGSSFFLGGTSASNGGVRYTTKGGTSSTQLESTQTNTRVVNIANGNLYFSTGSSITGPPAYPAGIYQIGSSGVSTSGGQSISLVAQTSSPYDFYFTPDGNTLYVADSSAGLERFTKSNGAFGSATVINTTKNLTGLTGATVNGTTTLYSVDPTNLLSFVDTNDSLATVTPTTLVTANTNEAFRGDDFAPAPEPGEVAVLSLCGLGLGGALLRRRMKKAAEPAA